MQTKSLVKAEFKVNAADRIIEGYASVFGNVDEVGDITVAGAFAKTLSERMPKGLIKVCRDHSTAVGMPMVVEEDSKGLFTKSKISATPAGDEILTLAQDGVYGAMSFMYDVVKADYGTVGDRSVRYLRELKLYEYGPVLFPANELATITAVKSLDSLGAWLGNLDSYLEQIRDNPASRDAAAALLGPRLPELQKALAELALPKTKPADEATSLNGEPPSPTTDPDQLQSLIATLESIRA